jgi:hypothetical protein
MDMASTWHPQPILLVSCHLEDLVLARAAETVLMRGACCCVPLRCIATKLVGDGAGVAGPGGCDRGRHVAASPSQMTSIRYNGSCGRDRADAGGALLRASKLVGDGAGIPPYGTVVDYRSRLDIHKCTMSKLQ